MRFPSTALLCLAWTILINAALADNWPRFRGPDGSGHSAEKGLPVTWDEKAVVWKTPLKGKGQSSPIIWGDRLFLTTAVDGGKERLVCCLDRQTGKLLWEQVAWKGTPEPTHVMNGHASATCVTDGERVYACFGKAGLHCYTVEGKHGLVAAARRVPEQDQAGHRRQPGAGRRPGHLERR